ncbi:TetR/AcrR family transcriptional regulator [Phenylobacterium sp.]|uniref:TetR/AcrR family transcriptional regulator n=1 Tax=Phenylobacterium sp. TaxID=1871053 RepID=UPI002FD924F2
MGATQTTPANASTPATLARRRSYHVGNVRSQLSQAASALLESEGPAALSLRAIARRTGVALGTVYYHYADKQALLGGLAVDGFRDLGQAIRTAVDSRTASGLRASGLAYLGFVQDRPALYGLMYETRETGRRDEVVQAEAAACAEMHRAIAMDFEPGVAREQVRQVTQAIWCCARGIAALALARGAGGRMETATVDEAVRGLEILMTRR